MAEEPPSPVSFNDFCEQHPELATDEARQNWGEALDAHRLRIADRLALHPDELHQLGGATFQKMLEGETV